MQVMAWLGGLAFAVSLGTLALFYLITLASPAGDPSLALRNAALDTGLFSIFALHHSLLARAWVQRWLAQLSASVVQRSVYVWVASALAIAMCVLWQPIAGVVYRVDGWWRWPFWLVQIGGVVLTLSAARVLDLRTLAGVAAPSRPLPAGTLRIAGPFRQVRHPIYLGWILIVCATPLMTANRFVFALVSSLYLVVAIPFEERSLATAFGESYVAYQRTVRWRLVPYLW